MSFAYTNFSTVKEIACIRSPTFRRFSFALSLCFISLYLIIKQQTNQNELIFDGETSEKVSDEDRGIDFTLEHCGCQRHLNGVNPNPPGLSYNQTTCSYDAYRRGPHQKIIGFSFYGNIDADYSKKKGYFEGIIGNLELVPKLYPGWTMRLYYDLDKKDPVLKDLCDLACRDTNIDICDTKLLPGTPFVDSTKVFAMNWRFFPTLDPQVDLFVSRDLDSRLNEREQAAVEEWLFGSKSFHFMRDHPQHGTPVLGCGWGCKMTDMVRLKWKTTWKKGFADKIVWANRYDWGPDQRFLSKYVWPWAKKVSIGHDSYTCRSYPYTKGFPTQRKNEPNNFVASVVSENHTLWEVCPEECRPKNHLDWIHC